MHHLKIWWKTAFKSPWARGSRAEECTAAKFYPTVIINRHLLFFSWRQNFAKYAHVHPHFKSTPKSIDRVQNFFQVKKPANSPFCSTAQILDLPLILLNLTRVWQMSFNHTQHQARTSEEWKGRNQIRVFLSHTN